MQPKDQFFEETNTPDYQENILIVSAMQDAEQEYNLTIAGIAKSSPVKIIEAFIQADKSEIAAEIVEAVDSGYLPPLKALAGIKAMESLTDMLTNKDPKKNPHADRAILLQSHVTDAAGAYAEKSFPLYGATFTKTEVGTKYDWSQCNDAKLIELELAAKKAGDELKARQEFLKTVPTEGLPIVDEETGETYSVYRPSKSSTSSVSVSFKKSAKR